jgi:hypothetical protein
MGRPSMSNQMGQGGPQGGTPNLLMDSWLPAARGGTPFVGLSPEQQRDMVRFMAVAAGTRGQYGPQYSSKPSQNPNAPVSPMQPSPTPSAPARMTPPDPLMGPYRY